MSKETREHLSALVDGEISPDTSRFLVRRLGSDVELRATWTRYHLVRDCLRHQDGTVAGSDLCARISKAIENEQPEIHRSSISKRWLKPVAGMAIAASVALMAIITVGPGTPGAPQATGELTSESEVEPFTSPQSLTPAPYSSQASYSGRNNSADRRMDPYLLRHYQATGSTNGKGFVTFVPIVVTAIKPSEEEEGKNPDENAESGKAEDSK